MTNFDNRTYIFDCEVFAHDWLFVFYSIKDSTYTVIHNDYDAIRAFMMKKPLLCGFNNKRYDDYILKAVLNLAEPTKVKQINDAIISGKNAWDIPFIKSCKGKFASFDLMDDMQQGLSLKAIEGHLFLPIRESNIPFDIQHELDADELEEVIQYCKYDVESTTKLYELREGYLQNKVYLGTQRGYTVAQSLRMTNAKLTSVYLNAVPVKTDDERNYHYPDKLKREYIPPQVFAFFDRIHDDSISDADLFTSKLELTVGECPCTLGFGGIHGAIPQYTEEETADRVIRNKDVASYYPHLMTLPLDEGKQYGFVSRAMQNPDEYNKVLEERVEAKKNGDKAKNLALKLVLNTTYGAMGNKTNDLYDPLNFRSVCITGQLFLLELSCHVVKECPSLKIIQLNTDGIMVSFDKSDEEKWQSITQEWQDRTGFELEEDFIHKIVQKDVNNYVEIACDGGSKVKGGCFSRGISPAGAFNVNNNAVIIAEALKAYLVDGTDPAETINACDDIKKYQYIVKISHKYTGGYQEVNGIKQPLKNRANRVYATPLQEYGKLYKYHAESGTETKIAGIPDHCLIDNENYIDITYIDKSWYIGETNRLIMDFTGSMPDKVRSKVLSLQEMILKMLGEQQ